VNIFIGLAIAAAVGFGYSNIFVTSPSPENLHTLFDFVFKVIRQNRYVESGVFKDNNF
jgi:N-acetyltransferase 10